MTTLTEDEWGSVKAHLQLPASARQSLRAEGNVTRQRSAAERLEMVGVERDLEPGVAQDPLDDEVEPVGDDGHADAVALALVDEGGKSRVDAQLRHGVQDLGRARLEQRHLPRHALARADPPGLPVLLDLLPGRVGKPLEQEVGDVTRDDRPVEIDEGVALHTRTRHVQGTR